MSTFVIEDLDVLVSLDTTDLNNLELKVAGGASSASAAAADSRDAVSAGAATTDCTSSSL